MALTFPSPLNIGKDDYKHNYFVYPCKTLYISQNYSGDTSHGRHNCASSTYKYSERKDYPWDEYCGGDGKSWMYCPCDEMEIMHIYTDGANTIWLQSTLPVRFAKKDKNGNYIDDYVTMQITHPTQADIDDLGLKKGMRFTRGQPICREGGDGRYGPNTFGNHFHFSVGRGEFISPGWWPRDKDYPADVWVIHCGKGGIKPEELIYVDDRITLDNRTNPTSTITSNGITFNKLPESEKGPREEPGFAGSGGGATITQGKLWGVDVGNPNGTIDYQLVKDAGVQFAIIRAGYTGHGTHYNDGTLKPYSARMHEDLNFENNYKGFKDVNIPIGAYYYSCATNNDEAEQEAQTLISILEKKDFELEKKSFEYPIFIDVEDKYNQKGKGKDVLANVVITFCETMKKAGYKQVGVYSNTDWFTNQINDSLLTDYIHWWAHWYVDEPSVSKDRYTIHQYSNKGIVNGIPRPKWPIEGTDVNWSYYDYATGSPITSTTTPPTSSPRRKRTEFSNELLSKEIEAKFDFNNQYMFNHTQYLGSITGGTPSWWYENNKGEIAWMGSCIEVFALKIKMGEKVKIYYEKDDDWFSIEDVLSDISEHINGPSDSSQPNVPEEVPETTTTTT
jgi:GH25 family lysozyme M1 (1,4-beta-N-acetylmuramidase)